MKHLYCIQKVLFRLIRLCKIVKWGVLPLWLIISQGLHGPHVFAQWGRYSRQYLFKSYNPNSGLSNRNVTCFEEDKTGFLWIGTQNGLNRFDGTLYKTFKYDPASLYSLPDNHITTLLADGYDNLWVGTQAGLAWYDAAKNRFKRLMFHPSDYKNTIVRLIAGVKGEVLFATKHAVYVAAWKAEQTVPEVHLLMENEPGEDIKDLLLYDDKLLVATEFGVAIAHYTPGAASGQVQRPVTCDKLNQLFYVHQLVQHPKGDVLACTSNGLYIVDLVNACFIPFPNAKRIGHPEVRLIHFIDNGDVFIVTGESVLLADAELENIEKLKANPLNPEALASTDITTFYTDSKGILWIGYEKAGFSKWDASEFPFQNIRHLSNDAQSLPGNRVYALRMHQKRIYVGTNKGLSCIQMPAYRFINLIPDVSVFDLELMPNGYLIIATDKGLKKIDTVQFMVKPFGVAVLTEQLEAVNTIYRLHNNNILVGTKRKGLFLLTNDGRLIWRISQIDDGKGNILDLKNITTLYQDSKRNLWVGSYTGLIKFDTAGILKKWYLSSVNDALSLPSNRINHITEAPTGELLVATQGGGLAVKNTDSDDFSIYNREGGFPSDNVQAILPENKELIWMSTDAGIVCFHMSSKTTKLYDERASLCSIDFVAKSACKSNSGKYLFGSNEGFAIFEPTVLRNIKIRPKVLISSLKVLDKPYEFDRPLWRIKELRLRHNENTVYFGFSALQFTLPALTKYYYKLEGVDADWNEAGTAGLVNYSNLDFGNYTFKVKAVTEGLSGEASVASLAIIIKPPFWREGWFKVVSFLSILLSALLFFQIRLRSVEYQKKALERIVEQRTRELKEKNEKIILQAQQLKEEKEKIDRINSELAAMVKELEVTLAKSNEQKRQIEESAQKIYDSLLYAKRMQHAFLPNFEHLKKKLDDVFVFYEPKDIVSGDFYWFAEKNGKLVIAAVDCTGHGVPGAFMSLIGNDKLTRAVNEQELLDPRQILEYVEYSMTTLFGTSKTDASNSEGMEMAVCVLDYRRNAFLFAGAHRPVYYVRDGQLIEVKGKPYGIGGAHAQRYEKVFETEVLPLQKGDMLYLFTDGFVGQLNGATGKKYMSGRFKQLLTEIAHLPCDAQKELISKEFKDWLQGGRQTDDVLVMGIRV